MGGIGSLFKSDYGSLQLVTNYTGYIPTRGTGSAVSVSPRCFVPPIGSTRGERHPCSLPLYSIPNSLPQGSGAPSLLGYNLFLGQCAAPPCGKTGWLRCRGIDVGRIGVFTRLDIAALMLFPGSLFPMRLSSARVRLFIDSGLLFSSGIQSCGHQRFVTETNTPIVV